VKEKAGRGAGTVVGTTTTEVIMEGSGAGAGAGAGTATGKEGGTGEEIMATRAGTGTVTAIAATGEERNDGWQGLDRDCQFFVPHPCGICVTVTTVWICCSIARSLLSLVG
jgi:hypothetical protein